jgi:UDP-glucose 4-epimerase
MREKLLWVVGRGGHLGSHLSRALCRQLPNARLWECLPQHFSWSDPPLLAEELSHAVARFAAAVRDQADAWAVLWCAGTGVMSSAAAVLEPEWSAWSRLLDLLGRNLARPIDQVRGAVFLASSAGGVFSGSTDHVLTEDTPPQPISEYGRHKLRMERALESWSGLFPNVSSLIGRISTLYGPGQDLRKAQGIISHLSRCVIYRKPVNIYVSLDTRRDYLFVDDCAHQVAAALHRMLSEQPHAILKVFASEEVTSLARIVGIFFHMAKRRPLIVLQRHREMQPISMQFRSKVWRDLEGLHKTDLAVGIHLVHEYQLALFQRGLLPPPDKRTDRMPYFIDPAHLTDKGADTLGHFYAEQILKRDSSDEKTTSR